MTLSDLASLGSFVSGIAVLVSLVFLFFQMRQMSAQMDQTERNQKALMHQGITNRVSELTRWLAEPGMADLMSRVEAGETEFTREELYRLKQWLHTTWISVRDTYMQHRSGLADQDMMNAALGAMRVILSQPVFRALWRQERQLPQWAEMVERLIADTPLAAPTDLVAVFKADLKDVVATRPKD